MIEYKSIGTPTRVLDGRDKITGQIQYAPDIKIPGMLHGRLVTSPHAHATISSIDASAALTVPGVVQVITAQELPDIPAKSRNRLFLARGRVIFAGQPVALVLAESAAAAEDGAEQVWVEYDALTAVTTISEALAEGAPLVWPGGKPGASGEAGAHGADISEEEEDEDAVKGPNIANGFVMKRGDIAAGFAEADVIIERTFSTSMVHQSYLEPMTHTAVPDAYGNGITVYASTQAPSMLVNKWPKCWVCRKRPCASSPPIPVVHLAANSSSMNPLWPSSPKQLAAP
ncbi:MAG: xanthine dehydrogenase family protein molybdopterin-binding subunit [Anaerolineae bacterium]|nr:xanthine dehydrogenase family protein molybdopterin-binding subunit [Anaerolineae bacterium]